MNNILQLPEKNSLLQIDSITQLLQEAIKHQASDIHLDPSETHYDIRMRRDGILTDIAQLFISSAQRMILQLKIMANMNIAEQRLPQDGRLTFTTIQELKFDFRLNTCPTQFGERVSLRLLNLQQSLLPINQLGFTNEQQTLVLNQLNKPQGLILVTGPTGSGKTITLYSALQYLNRREKNILSVEDPIEIILPGISQVSIHPKIGLDFAIILRAFLRQDPDIIMVGEIRDTETAMIALQAAQTGHLVLSTLHTNSAIDTLVRLQSMGIAMHQLIHSIQLIIAQRLIRKRCLHCATEDTHACLHCHSGYQGRTAIFEVLPMTNTITQCLLKNAARETLLSAAKATGFLSMWEVGMELVMKKVTTLNELQRVVVPLVA